MRLLTTSLWLELKCTYRQRAVIDNVVFKRDNLSKLSQASISTTLLWLAALHLTSNFMQDDSRPTFLHLSLVFPFDFLPSPVHLTGFFILIFTGFFAIFILLPSNNSLSLYKLPYINLRLYIHDQIVQLTLNLCRKHICGLLKFRSIIIQFGY